MHIHGHSTAEGRHAARRQQYRVWDAAQKEHGRHIPAVNANAEMQAGFGAVAGFEGSNQLAARHRFSA